MVVVTKKIDLTKNHDVIGAYDRLNFDDIRYKYTDPGTSYAFSVLDGKTLAGYMLKLACFRHVMDLKRSEQNEADFPYHYSVGSVNKILNFAKIAPNVDSGKPVPLMPWQQFVFCLMFGWRDNLNHKRFTRVLLSIGRGQGKTYLMSIYLIYSFLLESLGKNSQYFLITARDYQQIQVLYGYVKLMLDKLMKQQPLFEALAKKDGLIIHKQTGVDMTNFNNHLITLSLNSDDYDSKHFTTAVFDEIGAVPDDHASAGIVSGQIKTPNHQYVEISTSYPDPTAPFHKEQIMMKEAMERDFDRANDSMLCLVWSQDSQDEAYKPETWLKSNPLLDLEGQKETLLKGLIDKRDQDLHGGTFDDFLIKNMNLWLQKSTNNFLKYDDVASAVVDHFDIDGRTVYVGFDYSMFSDNTAIAFVYPYVDSKGNQKFHIEQHSFIPWMKAGSIEAKEKQDGINYRLLEKQGYCTITDHPQGLINTDQVYEWFTNFISKHNLKVIFFGYDRYNATDFVKTLDANTALPLVDIPQRTSYLMYPTKFLQKIFVEHSVTRLDDQVMEKALLNAEIYEDKLGIQVSKAKATLKIDVVDAMIDAFYQGMNHFKAYGITNDKSLEVKNMTEDDVVKWFKSQESGLI